MRKPCSGKSCTVICSSHCEPARHKCFHSLHIKSALNVCKTRGMGSISIEMIYILLSSQTFCYSSVFLGAFKLLQNLLETFKHEFHTSQKKMITDNNTIEMYLGALSTELRIHKFTSICYLLKVKIPYFIVHEHLYWKVTTHRKLSSSIKKRTPRMT